MAESSSYRILAAPLSVEVARFGTPLALGMGLQTTFNLVDAYIIAQLEHEKAGPALGAIGICDQLAALGTILSYGLSTATASMISRRWGQGDRDGARRIAWQSVLFVLALGAGLGLLGGFGAEWLMHDVVGAKGLVASLGAEYLRVMLGGSFTIFLLLHLTTIQRALGSSKTPVSMLIAANVVNFVLAVLLVYGPGDAPAVFAWGPALAGLLGLPRLELVGAAWATVIARCLVLVPLIVALGARFKLFTPAAVGKPDPEVFSTIWRLGWPSSAQLVVRISAMLLTQSLVARAFTTETDQSATTALGIVFRLETMALFVGMGWGSAAQTFVGQNLGATNLDRAKQSGWYAAAYNAAMMAVLALLYVRFGPAIVRFFDDDPAVVSVAMSYLKWVSLSYVGLGVGIVLGSAIQGAGATMHALLLDLFVVLCFQLPASLLVLASSGASHVHVWQVVALTYVAFGLVYGWSYKKGRFLRTVIA